MGQLAVFTVYSFVTVIPLGWVSGVSTLVDNSHRGLRLTWNVLYRLGC